MTSSNQSTRLTYIPTPWIQVLQVAWVLLALLSVVIFIASLPGYLAHLEVGTHGDTFVVEPSALRTVLNAVNVLASISIVLISLTLSWFLFRQKPNELMAMFLAFYLLVYAIGFAGPLEALISIWPALDDSIYALVAGTLVGPMSIALFTLLPDGRFVPDWSRWLIPASVLIIPFAFSYSNPQAKTGNSALVWIGSSLALVILVASLYAQVYRYRKVSSHTQKQQTKWLIYGLSLWLLFMLISTIPYMVILNLPPGSSLPWWVPLSEMLWFGSLMFLPLSLTIAVMRYHLYGIDILINRTLLFGTLTAIIVALYVLVVGGLGVLFHSNSNLLVALTATGLIAVLFQPLRQRLQHGINKMMYGERDDPVTVFARMGQLVEATSSPKAMLSGLVETIAQTLKLPYAGIELGIGDQSEVVAVYGTPIGKPVRFPLVYQSLTIGNLAVSPRVASEEFNRKDLSLLENIARQTGAAAYSVQLTEKLQRSRVQLVTAREEERRRIRRDLHDELGPQLASQTLIIEALEKRLQNDPDSAYQLLEQLKKYSQSAVKDIRRLVYDLRPPALDDLGLVNALREILATYNQSGLECSIEAPEPLPTLPAAVEVAVYRIIQEAATNVMRHAGAQHCVARIEIDKTASRSNLQLTIEDDGKGIPAERNAGIGLNSMQERALELGGKCWVERLPNGGTRVCALLPLSGEIQ
jgi:signal transduction histidine kinase